MYLSSSFTTYTLWGNFLLQSPLHRGPFLSFLDLTIFFRGISDWLLHFRPITFQFLHATNSYIFATFPFSVHMPLIATFSSPDWGVGKSSGSKKFKFMVIVGHVCYSGIGITLVQVSRLPMPHLENDKWKCTMFTNKSYIVAHHINKILQVNIYSVHDII